MPILGKEPDLFPAELLDDPQASAPDGQWWVIYTLSRREKDLMRRLRSLNIAHYGPLVPHRTRSPQGRIRTSYLPLFAGYIFVFANEEGRYNTVSTGCVSKCIEVTEHETLLEDLKQVRALEEFGEDLQSEIRPTIGQRARIVRGPLAGKELVGTITQVKSQHRLTILVNFLQQGASVVVDEADLELI